MHNPIPICGSSKRIRSLFVNACFHPALNWTFVFAFTAAVGGCVTFDARTGSDLPAQTLTAENKGIVIIHTSLHEDRWQVITGTVARRDAAGYYSATEGIALKAMLNLEQLPGQVVLPAGDYAIVSLRCQQPYNNKSYSTRASQKDGRSGYEKPLATFKVNAGEVVDVGSLRIAGAGRTPGFFSTALFRTSVTPIPESWLGNLAAKDPRIYSARVVRPMEAGNI
jgi:hypothetical protein